jgi:hypothetical protein
VLPSLRLSQISPCQKPSWVSDCHIAPKNCRVGVAGGENFRILTQNFVNAVTAHFGKKPD